ncbi:MAG: hypothetical protein LC808_19235, partial [Actinobacteria bacterium]|nr:hypothetical protein [Actinomycetota bacterium]
MPTKANMTETVAMQLTFLGKETQGGGSPTLFATDRDTYIVQGWMVPGREDSVEIPSKLLGYLERDTQLAAVLYATGRDSYILSGVSVTDVKALGQMDMPDHETCVEVEKVRKGTLMQPVQGEAFDDLFRTFKRTAFHLELKDSYHTPHEAGPFDLFMEGQPDDFDWHQPWLRLVRGATKTGKSITRVRVVTVPHSDYVRWGLSVAPLNLDAGEDIRWLPRHLTDDIDFPADDYWLFDDDRVVFTVFEDGGRFMGGVETSDSELIEQC